MKMNKNKKRFIFNIVCVAGLDAFLVSMEDIKLTFTQGILIVLSFLVFLAAATIIDCKEFNLADHLPFARKHPYFCNFLFTYPFVHLMVWGHKIDSIALINLILIPQLFLERELKMARRREIEEYNQEREQEMLKEASEKTDL